MLLRTAVIGDFHLAKLDSRVPNFQERQWDIIYRITDEIVEAEIDKVVLLGDVFDRPSPGIGIAQSLIDYFMDYKQLQFAWICGNHDKITSEPAMIDFIDFTSRLGGGLTNLSVILKPETLSEFPYAGFLPYPHKNPLPETFISFAHVERPGAKWPNGDLCTATGDWVEDHYFIIGHLHDAQDIENTIYTGSPFQLSWGESTNQRHWGETGFNDNGDFFYIRHPIRPNWMLINLDVNYEEDLKAIKPDPYFYKLRIHPDLVLPTNFLANNPNCFRTQLKLQDMNKAGERTREQLEAQLELIKMSTGLPEYLTNLGYLTPEEVEWSVQHFNDTLVKLGLSDIIGVKA